MKFHKKNHCKITNKIGKRNKKSNLFKNMPHHLNPLPIEFDAIAGDSKSGSSTWRGRACFRRDIF